MPKFNKSDFSANSKVNELTCDYCNRIFYSNKPFTKFCSTTCRVYSHKKDKSADLIKIDGLHSFPITDKHLESLENYLELCAETNQRFDINLITPSIWEAIQGRLKNYDYLEPNTTMVKEIANRLGYSIVGEEDNIVIKTVDYGW